MRKSTEKSLLFLGLCILLFFVSACSKTKNEIAIEDSEEKSSEEKNSEETISNEKDSDGGASDELEAVTTYDESKTLQENIEQLNNKISETYGTEFTVMTVEEYEASEKSDWILVIENDKVGIDTGTWKYENDLVDMNSMDAKYMNAVLDTCNFFYGDKMGLALWQLTGDLLDGGVDETIYGFEHQGGEAIYENGDSATFYYSETYNFEEDGTDQLIMYIWLTPGEHRND